MKRILISNKFYYNRGGDSVASLALEKLLRAKGHPVAFFSMQYPLNFPSEWDDFFLSNIRFDGNIIEKYHAVSRLFYSNEVNKKFSELIDVFKPDVVHLNNIHSYISPYIGELAHKKGIKVVWSLHDYKLICPTYLCLRNGRLCELCIQHQLQNVFLKKCMKNSLLASFLAYIEAIVWNKRKLERNTDMFIAPSSFMKKKMMEGGFSEEKIVVIPHFINRTYSSKLYDKKADYYCFVGRLSEEKGIQTLVNVAKNLPYKLIVVGNGPLYESLNKENNHNIEFVGFKEWNEIESILGQAKFLVSPSECYEVFGISNIEAQCLGTPVLGANIGGIPETINVPKSGLLFESRNEDDLKEKIVQMYQTSFDYQQISRDAQERFSADKYYEEIIKLYEQ